MKRLIRHFLLLFLLVGIGSTAEARINDHYTVTYLELANEVVTDFAKEAEVEFDLTCVKKGGRVFRDVRGVFVEFVAYRRSDSIEQARELEVTLVKKLLKRLNENLKIRPYILHYPFRPNKVHMTIAFKNQEGGCYYDGSITHIVHEGDSVCYYVEKPLKKRRMLIEDELYEEAEATVEIAQAKAAAKDKAQVAKGNEPDENL